VPAPAFALRLAVGEMATPLLLASTRMSPAGALADGYRFQYEEVGDALSSLL
jgi:NAD dependent epimerase/dehydratase family enzyme